MEKIIPRERMQGLLSINEVASAIDCSVRNVYELVRKKKMPAFIRVGGLTRFRESEIEYWIAAGCPAID